MGREAATYVLALSADAASAVLVTLDAAGCDPLRDDGDRVDFVLRDPNRYWIDVRVHRRDEPRLQIRIALTNDTWSIRAPLQRALSPLPPGFAGTPLLDGEGRQVAVAGADGWLLAVEDDFGRRRDEFVARVGDFIAPISADHVYMYVHQTRWNIDNDEELAWHREREIAQMEEMWDPDGDAPPPDPPT